MRKTIIFIRHGKPLLSPSYSLVRLVKGQKFNEYCCEYEKSTIDPEFPPPEAVIDIVRNASHYISSDLRRTIDSCTRLQFKNTVFYESLREAEMPFTKRTRVAMPLIFWMLISRAKWRLGITCNVSESRQEFIMRIQGVSERLHQKSGKKECVVVMAHGIAIHYLKKYLVEKGWRTRQSSMLHWGVTQLENKKNEGILHITTKVLYTVWRIIF